MLEKIKSAAKYIKSINQSTPQTGIVLGSGLGDFVKRLENPTFIKYSEIPNFKKTTVAGHDGQLILGDIGKASVVVMQGRTHAYEGISQEEVVFPVRVLKELGIKNLIITNAAGGVNTSYSPGDLVCIDDHINFTGRNPLVGPNLEEMGPRFPDMTNTYHRDLRKIVAETSQKYNLNIKKGIYFGVLGPTYETPAEIRMIRLLGGDLVGMSTIPEVIAANHIGLRVCGISCVTNMAAGIENRPLRHEDIKEEGLKVMERFSSLLVGLVQGIAEEH